MSEKGKVWCVKESNWYAEGAPRDELCTTVRLFRTREEALEEISRIIREDWTSEVVVDGESKPMADCKGMAEQDSVKWSDWYYSEDGALAWFTRGSASYRVEANEIELP